MITRLYVRPAVPVAVVRDPVSRRPLPKDGGYVAPTQYWHRRLMFGDVELATEPAPQENDE